jgi:CRISPR-associated protein Cas2
MSRFWMVAYDIYDDGIRRKVANILKNYGTRVQYSVFECRLEETQFVALRTELTELLEEEDSLRWYPLCKWCRDKVFWQGGGKRSDDEGFIIA